MAPHDAPWPSTETEECDLGDCHEPWALEVERRNGPRQLRLCEEHATRWLQAERELEAEIEEMRRRGETQHAPLFGLARAKARRELRRDLEGRGRIAAGLAVTRANVQRMLCRGRP